MIEQFVEATNGYARDTNRKIERKPWWDVSVAEMWIFFAVVIFLGTIEAPQRRLFLAQKL